MEKNKKDKKVSWLNFLGLGIAGACFVYLFIIYVVMFSASPAYAQHMATSNAGHYALQNFVCIAMFLIFIAELFFLPFYIKNKIDGRFSSRTMYSGVALFICAALNLILIIIFWSSLGPIFDGNPSNGNSTIYRIFDLLTSFASFGGLVLFIAYSPRYDRIVELKKKSNKL